MFKYETHLHTAEGSACASATGAQQARRYKELGYDGIFVTDHFFNGNCAVPRDLSWPERVARYCSGFNHAKEEGDRIGLKVFFGIEYTYGGCDLLSYGLSEQWLLDNPDVLEISVYEYCNRVHRDGGYIVHAHPFREADYLHEIRLMPDWVDAVEIYNVGNKARVMDDRAAWYADQYGLPVTAGTDNHHLTADPVSGVITEEPLMTPGDYFRAVTERRVKLIIP
ncbi:MAG: histidinol-phosphatase [Ruminococcus sp.]|nr:histidinol-phosphatase [Ruminococcus sp.]